MAIRTLPCLYLPYFLLLFSNFQDGAVLNYAWAWACMPGTTMLGCCGKFLQWTRTRQPRASIAIFYRVAYLAFDVPSSPNARLDAYLTSHKTYLIIRCNSSSSLHPFSHGRAGRKCFAENVWGYDVNAADVGLFPMATPTARRDPDVLGWA